jgi:hypothetical protein
MLSRANATTASLDLVALENAEPPAPAVIIPARPTASATVGPDAARVDKVA